MSAYWHEQDKWVGVPPKNGLEKIGIVEDVDGAQWNVWAAPTFVDMKWSNVKITSENPIEHKANYQLGWNGERLCESSDLQNLRKYRPSLLEKIIPIIQSKAESRDIRKEARKFIDFILKDQDRVDFFLRSICEYSNKLDESFFYQYTSNIRLDALAKNETFPWNEKLIKLITSQEFYIDYIAQGPCSEEVYKNLLTNNSFPRGGALFHPILDMVIMMNRHFDLITNPSTLWSNALFERIASSLNGYTFGTSGGWMIASSNEHLAWSEDFIIRYLDEWDWEVLSKNQSLPWTEALIERFEDKWDWSNLSVNWALPWSESFIERYRDKWDWANLSVNRGLPWSEDFIERYKEKWDEAYWFDFDEWCWFDELQNESWPWSIRLIERYEDRWDWDGLSQNKKLPWGETLIERYKENWDWSALSRNPGLPWSEELVQLYEDRWDWSGYGSILSRRSDCGISENEALRWSEELIERYKDKWSWVGLSKNKALPWSETLIKRYEKKWCWSALSGNQALPWSESLIKRYETKWNWAGLIEHDHLEWVTRRVEIDNSLCANPAIPWSEAIIQGYEARLDWYLLARNKGVMKLFATWTRDEVEAAFEAVSTSNGRF